MSVKLEERAPDMLLPAFELAFVEPHSPASLKLSPKSRPQWTPHDVTASYPQIRVLTDHHITELMNVWEKSHIVPDQVWRKKWANRHHLVTVTLVTDWFRRVDKKWRRANGLEPRPPKRRKMNGGGLAEESSSSTTSETPASSSFSGLPSSLAPPTPALYISFSLSRTSRSSPSPGIFSSPLYPYSNLPAPSAAYSQSTPKLAETKASVHRVTNLNHCAEAYGQPGPHPAPAQETLNQHYPPYRDSQIPAACTPSVPVTHQTISAPAGPHTPRTAYDVLLEKAYDIRNESTFGPDIVLPFADHSSFGGAAVNTHADISTSNVTDTNLSSNYGHSLSFAAPANCLSIVQSMQPYTKPFTSSASVSSFNKQLANVAAEAPRRTNAESSYDGSFSRPPCPYQASGSSSCVTCFTTVPTSFDKTTPISYPVTEYRYAVDQSQSQKESTLSTQYSVTPQRCEPSAVSEDINRVQMNTNRRPTTHIDRLLAVPCDGFEDFDFKYSALLDIGPCDCPTIPEDVRHHPNDSEWDFGGLPLAVLSDEEYAAVIEENWRLNVKLGLLSAPYL